MEGRIAGPQEVRQAIEALTIADRVRLNAYAENRIARLGPLAGTYGADDLLQDSVLSLLEEGRRYWRPGSVDIVGFLMGTMRSLASNFARKSAAAGILNDSERLRDDEDGPSAASFFDTVPSPNPNPEEILLNNQRETYEQRVATLEALVKDDMLASLVFSGMKSGNSGSDIVKALGITERELRAAKSLIRLKAQARWPEGLSYV